MIYLLLAIFSSAMVSLCMRLAEQHIRNNMVMFTANYAACLGIAALYMGAPPAAQERGLAVAAGLGVLSGFLYLLSFVLLQTSIRLNGVILSCAAMKLGGVLVPVAVAMVFFGDRAGWLKLAGVALAVAAVVLINLEKGGAGQGNQKQWLVFLLLGSGLTDTMANVYDKVGAAARKDQYLVFTFLAAMLVAAGMACAKRQRPAWQDVLCGLVIGVPNYFSARFLLLALGSVPAVIAYPVFSVGTILLITLVGALVFKEVLTRQKRYAFVLILAALVLLNG